MKKKNNPSDIEWESPDDDAAEAGLSETRFVDHESAVLAGQTVVMESPAADLEPGSGGVLDGSPELYIAAIKERLAQYLDNAELLVDFRPGLEWDLSTKGRLSETDILQCYAVATKLSVIEEESLEAVERFPELGTDYLKQWLCLPVSWDSESAVIVVARPYDISTIAWHWRNILNRSTTFYLGQRSHIERTIEGVYAQFADDLDPNRLDMDGDSEEALAALALEAPIVRLVNDMFARAIEVGASDIHVEPAESQLAIRFRIDGSLQTAMSPPIASYSAIASRIKLIGGLNIAERRLPQDGRTEVQIGRAKVDVRISTLPSLHGESLVLRILRKDIESFDLDNIGMGGQLKEDFLKLIQLPHGMILVVGPTGSGKTTTLYGVLKILNSVEKKIITVEDPIEYQTPGITQMQVRASIGLTFASGLRSIVRQDPDIILVGEIRDRETAEIAIHAALTGHLVLSTLHTNDATGAISRLADMGVEPFLIASALVGVMSQRLVRRVCTHCNGTGTVVENGSSRNCRPCSGRGLSGRVGIFEYLHISDGIRRAAMQGADNVTLGRLAREEGMKTLREDGDEKAAAGVTTSAEIAAVCQLDA